MIEPMTTGVITLTKGEPIQASGAVQLVQDLSEKDLDNIITVLDPDVILGLRTKGKEGLTGVQDSIKAVDKLIAQWPSTKESLILYTQYENAPEFEKATGIIEKAFLTGTTTKPNNNKDVFIVSYEVPKGTRALKIEDGYILARNQEIQLSPNDKPSTIKLSSMAHITLSIEEFYNKAHSNSTGRFVSSGGGKGGGGEVSKSKKVLKAIAVGLIAAVVIAASIIVISAGTSVIKEKAENMIIADPEVNVHVKSIIAGRRIFLQGERNRKKNLNKDEKFAVTHYTQSGHQAINKHLRFGDAYPGGKKLASHMDTAFKSAAVETKGITVYRGLHFNRDEEAQNFKGNLKVGNIIQDKGFLSTSTNVHTANAFSHGSKVRMEIKTKSTSKALSGLATEKELILNRGTAVKITKIETDADGFTVAHGEEV